MDTDDERGSRMEDGGLRKTDAGPSRSSILYLLPSVALTCVHPRPSVASIFRPSVFVYFVPSCKSVFNPCFIRGSFFAAVGSTQRRQARGFNETEKRTAEDAEGRRGSILSPRFSAISAVQDGFANRGILFSCIPAFLHSCLPKFHLGSVPALRRFRGELRRAFRNRPDANQGTYVPRSRARLFWRI
jgi:hypothetical protein